MLALRRTLFAAASGVLPYARRARGETVVFTSFHGRGYRGNPRALFEHLLATRRLDPVWLTTNAQLVATLRARFGKGRAALAHSLRGIDALRKARAIVLSHGITDLPYLHLSRRAIVLQTWHGLPTKKGELMGGDLSLRERLALRAQWAPVDFMLSSSPLVSDLYGARFGLPHARMLELGYPAYDGLLNRTLALDTAAAFAAAPPHERVILYAPTFRKSATTRFFPFADFDARGVAAFLEEERALLCLRPHPNDRLDVARALSISPRIVLADENVIEDSLLLLASADLVVTDYSGIYLEGLLADVPCVFFPYDLAEYERGLPWDYDTFTPGPKVHTQAAMLQAWRRALREPSADAAERKRVRQVFFTHHDARSSERVASWLEQRIGARPR